MDEARPAPAARRRRPVGVIIMSVGLVLTAVAAYLVAAAALLGETVPWADVPVLGQTANVVAVTAMPAPVVEVAALVVGTLALVVSIGFFLLRPWGWTGLMLLAAVSLTINLVAVVLGTPNEVSMAVAIVAVLYANQRRIQLLFRGTQVVAFESAKQESESSESTGPDVRSRG